MRKTAILAYEMLDYSVRIAGDKLALKQDDRSLTYSQWNDNAQKVANALTAAGIGVGDRVAVMTYNRIEQFLILYATIKLGAVYVPVNYRLAPKELKYVLDHAQVKAIFSEGDLCGKIDAIAAETELTTYVNIDTEADHEDHWVSFDTFTKDAVISEVVFQALPESPVYQMYTSGTTGFPKGVVITQQQLAAYIVHTYWVPPRVDAGKPNLVVAPLFHCGALGTSLTFLCAGRPVVVLKEFDPVQVVEAIVAEKVADVGLVPAMVQMILQQVPNLEQYDFSSLEKIIYGASTISVDVLTRAMKTFGCNFQQGYGMTEMVASATALTADDHIKALNGRPELLRSCGRPGLNVDLKIVNPETRNEVPVGEVGEIALRAPHAMEGYSKQPEKTAEVLDEDGWYYSGDGGYVDAEGYVYIKDRIKDMVVSGGENIYPAEVENALMSHPDIEDVAVIGLPDGKFGEAVVAICVPRFGAKIQADAMVNYCREHIAGYKIPRRYECVEALPRNPAGKILKRELRKQYK